MGTDFKIAINYITNWVTLVQIEIDISNCIGSSKIKFLQRFC